MNAAFYVNSIKENVAAVKNTKTENPSDCAYKIRKSLELSVKLFYLEKYGIEFPDANFNLYDAISNPKLHSCFNELIVSDMHALRKICNDVIHNSKELSVEELSEMLNRLEKCLQSIGEVIGVSFRSDPHRTSNPKIETDNKTISKLNMDKNATFAQVWDRIIRNEGKTFYTVTNLPFTYKVLNNNFLLTTRTSYLVSKSDIATVVSMWPVDKPGDITHIVRSSSYIYAILSDPQILGR